MATINDVAERAGVSVTTVSRVLNNRGYISEQTKQKVFQAMETLHYQPNEIARSLLRKRSNVLGLIVPKVAHPFFGEFANAVEYYAHQSGFKILLSNSEMDAAKEREYVEMMRRHRVDGIIIGSHTLNVEEYRTLQYPIVTIDRQIGSNPYVASDNRRGGELAAELLLAKGCRKVAHICGNLQLNMLSNLRTDGFESVMRQRGVDYVVYQTDLNSFDQESYHQVIQRLFEEHPDVDGVFATSDLIAIFLMKWCHRLGRDVPRQLRIIGYDDIHAATWVTPELTTIRQPVAEMGRTAVEVMLRQLDELPCQQQHVLPVELVERGST